MEAFTVPSLGPSFYLKTLHVNVVLMGAVSEVEHSETGAAVERDLDDSWVCSDVVPLLGSDTAEAAAVCMFDSVV